MFEQDYIMRQIKEMTAVIARVFFGKKTYESFPMLQEAERQKAFALIEQIRNGEPKKAVEELDRLTDNNTMENLIIGLEFFSQLSDMSEHILLKDMGSRNFCCITPPPRIITSGEKDSTAFAQSCARYALSSSQAGWSGGSSAPGFPHLFSMAGPEASPSRQWG